jgi:hypothetical protein
MLMIGPVVGVDANENNDRPVCHQPHGKIVECRTRLKNNFNGFPKRREKDVSTETIKVSTLPAKDDEKK